MDVKSDKTDFFLHPSPFTFHLSPGFTLFELLIVLVIIGVMAAMVVPRTGSNFDGVKLKADVKKVAAILRYARSLAVSENRRIKAVFKPADGMLNLNAALLTSDDDSYPWEIHEIVKETASIHTYKLSAASAIDITNGFNQASPEDLDEIVFYPEGGSSGGVVVLRNNKNQQYKLVVNEITGSISIDESIASDIH